MGRERVFRGASAYFQSRREEVCCLPPDLSPLPPNRFAVWMRGYFAALFGRYWTGYYFSEAYP